MARASVETRAGLSELISLRGLIVGRIADYERAEEIAEQLVRDAPTDPRSLLARARTRASFHRFNDALADVDRAERLSLDAETANGERAAIFQALGRYDESYALREEAAKRQASFENLAALVGLLCRARRNGGSRTAIPGKRAAGIAAFRRFHWLFSTSSWDSCG